jgi:predicted permease
MRRITETFRKLSLLLHRRRFRSELDEEMAYHRTEAERDLAAGGMSPAQARTAARRQFGNQTLLRERSQEAVSFPIESIWQDVRYAIRQRRRGPGFTLAVVLTLALGVGANTAIFSLVHASLLRALPYPQAGRILAIEDERITGSSAGGMTGVPRYFDLKARSRSFDSLSFFYFEHPTLIAGTRLPENVDGVAATGQFWRVFGAHALLGRTFDEQDDRPKAPEVVVLSYRAWQRLFGGSPSVIGSIVTMDKLPTTIIGVMPREFEFPSSTDVWRPTHFAAPDWSQYRGDGVRFARVYGRLKPEISPMTAQNELRTIGSQLSTQYTESDAQWQFRSESLRDNQYKTLRPALLVLLAASTALLLIACINVANLLLSRATTRRREVALRHALGASRTRLLQQHLTESLLLALLGGGTGLGVTFFILRLAGTRLPDALQQAASIFTDWSVVWFALGVSALTGIAFGLAPSFTRRNAEMNESLKSVEGRMAGPTGSRLRDSFIAVQVGLSLVLVVGACLMVQSLWRLTRTPLGFDTDHVLTFQIKLPWGADQAAMNRFFAETQRRMEQLPGVTAVGQATALPMDGYNFQNSYDADWLARTPHQDSVRAEVRAIAGDYLKALGIPLLAGRELRELDSAVLVNQEFVHQYLNGQSPLGHHLIYDKTTQVQIAGVIGNIRGTTASIANDIRPEIYFAVNGAPSRSFVIRSQMARSQLESLDRAIRQQVHQVDPQQAVSNVSTLDSLRNQSFAEPQLNMALLVGFAVIALALACVGIYGVIAYSVAQRRQEIGVRMALGATRSQIASLFLGRSATAAAIGLASGTLAALMLVRLLRSQLYGTSPYDPLTFVAAIVLLLVPVLLASLRPALKAASVNPVEALRAE